MNKEQLTEAIQALLTGSSLDEAFETLGSDDFPNTQFSDLGDETTILVKFPWGDRFIVRVDQITKGHRPDLPATGPLPPRP